MRIAAVYDIHGNLPALDAVLEDILQAHVDLLIVGGDVLPGPMPVETMERLLHLTIPAQFILGNGDREVLAVRRGTETDGLPEQAREAVQWVAQQLRAKDEEFLASWLTTLHLSVDGLGGVLFCHATPRDDVEIFTRLTPPERLLPV
ncbi:MAG TPA: metallophosphoesterase, partial [Bryobacteraceae bacterium]